MGTFHVVPENDLIEHVVDEKGACACGPEPRPVERDDGSIGWVLVHHSLDGREVSSHAGCSEAQEIGGLMDEKWDRTLTGTEMMKFQAGPWTATVESGSDQIRLQGAGDWSGDHYPRPAFTLDEADALATVMSAAVAWVRDHFQDGSHGTLDLRSER